jgi:hypothetical protein
MHGVNKTFYVTHDEDRDVYKKSQVIISAYGMNMSRLVTSLLRQWLTDQTPDVIRKRISEQTELLLVERSKDDARSDAD